MPVRVGRAERDRVMKSYERFERQGGRVDVSRIPDTYPPLGSFFFDDSANLWVQPSHRLGATLPLDVFDTTGRYLGRIDAPGRLLARPSPVVRGGLMAAVARDDDDVPVVMLMRLTKPGTGR